METTPATPVTRTAKVRTVKNAVPKSSGVTPQPVAQDPAAAAPRKRKAPTKKVTEPSPTTAAADMTSMIATAAYFLAEQRQFAPGYETQDWLAAEQLVCGSPPGK